jgi:hypothetical protein
MIQSCPKKWVQWLALAEFWYNTTPHSAHGKTPFEVLYGHPPRHFGISASTQCTTPDLEQWLQDRTTMQEVKKHNLQRAQIRMKTQADKHRQEREFNVGDWVYVKLQPYVQMSVARRSSQKLSYKYFGPYIILQKVGPIAYKLQLPESSQIHPVIHVSQLKQALPPGTVVSSDADLQCLTSITAPVPLQVMETRLCKVANKAVEFGRIQWSNLPADWTTWEVLCNINTSG